MSTLPETLRRRLEAGGLEPVDLALADWGWRHGGGADGASALALASHALGRGHICVRLAEPDAALGPAATLLGNRGEEKLVANPLVSMPDASEPRPLILEDGRLYLQRYHEYETRLAARLGERLAVPPETVAAGTDEHAGDGPDWQAVGLFVARRHRFAVISGGPGTGKTYTVVRLMLQLIADALAAETRPPVFRLAAPTGKAAARMLASVGAGLETLQPGNALRGYLPTAATTLHRLLGLTPASPQPRHDRARPLPADVVIVDEASMVDLPLMAKLADAVADDARLILLGDRYQLASVESGAVLADLCAPAGVNAFTAAQSRAAGPLLGEYASAREGSILGDHVVTLQTGRRFAAGSAIGRFAAAINAGEMETVDEVLATGGDALRATFDIGGDSVQALIDELAAAYAPLHEADNPGDALAGLERVRLLTATRIGPLGSEALNARIAATLARRFDFDRGALWYHGRPVMVTRNDPRAGLFNGDIGIVRQDADGRLAVWFRVESGLKRFHPSACPAHITVYAMTIHKSQGSEFDRVHLLLPPADSRTLSRELVYTGATRARHALHLLATREALAEAISHTSQRVSGLAERLARG